MIAAISGIIAIVKALLEKGADINAYNKVILKLNILIN